MIIIATAMFLTIMIYYIGGSFAIQSIKGALILDVPKFQMLFMIKVKF